MALKGLIHCFCSDINFQAQPAPHTMQNLTPEDLVELFSSSSR